MRQIVQLTTNALFPVYLIMFLGYFCKRGGLVKEEQQASLSRLGMNMFLPASLFNNIYKADLANLTNYHIFIYCCIAMLVNFFLILLIVTKCEKERFNRSAIIQAGFRTNYAILGLPLVANLHSEFIGLASLVGVLVIPLQNVLAIIILEYYSGRKVSAGHIIREILRNKQIIGTLLGTLVLLSGFRLPGFMESALNTFPGISSPLPSFLRGRIFPLQPEDHTSTDLHPGRKAGYNPADLPFPGCSSRLPRRGIPDSACRVCSAHRRGLLCHDPECGRQCHHCRQCRGPLQRIFVLYLVLLDQSVYVSRHRLIGLR